MLFSRFSQIAYKRSFSSSTSVAAVKALVVAEQEGGVLNASTLNTITAASALGGEVDAIVGGTNAREAAAQLSGVEGVSRVLLSEDVALDHGLAEVWAPFVADVVQAKEQYTHIVGLASASGKSVLPRLAALLDVQPISEITAVKDENTFERPIYAGNAIATVSSKEATKVLTVRSTAFEAASSGEPASDRVVELDEAPHTTDAAQWLSQELTKSERPELTSASIVVSGGRALKSAENFQIIYDFADKLNAAVGASRAAVDAGYCPNDMQVGQTGKIVAPQLYFAVGISGAIQHVAGMKDSKVIVAVNKDPEAPIFQLADYGLVGDLFKVIPELQSKLQ